MNSMDLNGYALAVAGLLGALGTFMGAYGMYRSGRRAEVKDINSEQRELYNSMLEALKKDVEGCRKEVSELKTSEEHWRATALSNQKELIESKMKITAMEAEMSKLKEQLTSGLIIDKSITDGIKHCIISTNHLGIIEAWNCEATRLLGWLPSEVLGRNIKIIIPDELSDAHDVAIAEFIKTGKSHIIGVGREVQAKTKHAKLVDVRIMLADIKLTETDHILTAVLQEVEL